MRRGCSTSSPISLQHSETAWNRTVLLMDILEDGVGGAALEAVDELEAAALVEVLPAHCRDLDPGTAVRRRKGWRRGAATATSGNSLWRSSTSVRMFPSFSTAASGTRIWDRGAGRRRRGGGG